MRYAPAQRFVEQYYRHIVVMPLICRHTLMLPAHDIFATLRRCRHAADDVYKMSADMPMAIRAI